jgi:uroporphyrin-III C-methyltransferase
MAFTSALGCSSSSSSSSSSYRRAFSKSSGSRTATRIDFSFLSSRRRSSRGDGRGGERRRRSDAIFASSSSLNEDDGKDGEKTRKKKSSGGERPLGMPPPPLPSRRGAATPASSASKQPVPSPSPSSSSKAPFVKLDTRVFIVGAGVGTGSIQNLTIRAANILKSADVVIYDDLGVDSDETLALCGVNCEKIYVGKRGGRAEKNTSQAEINKLLVELSASGKYKHVVRLKGGDPTIFGRLGNEIEALKRAKVKYEIVPGVSSLVASAAAVGMPLTETMRGGKHFACISGHDAKTNPDAFRDLADVDTVVVFMGGKNIASVVDALLMNATTNSEQAATNSRSSKNKRTKSTPCAVVRDVDGVKEKRWLGTLGDIVEKTEGERLSPCILIVGEIVKSATLHERNVYL